MGKGDNRRPTDIPYKELDLNWLLAMGRIDIDTYNSKVIDLKKLKSKKRKEKLL